MRISGKRKFFAKVAAREPLRKSWGLGRQELFGRLSNDSHLLAQSGDRSFGSSARPPTAQAKLLPKVVSVMAQRYRRRLSLHIEICCKVSKRKPRGECCRVCSASVAAAIAAMQPAAQQPPTAPLYAPGAKLNQGAGEQVKSH